MARSGPAWASAAWSGPAGGSGRGKGRGGEERGGRGGEGGRKVGNPAFVALPGVVSRFGGFAWAGRSRGTPVAPEGPVLPLWGHLVRNTRGRPQEKTNKEEL